MLRKKKRLNSHLQRIKVVNPQLTRIYKIKEETKTIHNQLKEHIQQHIKTLEKTAISKIKSNPKYFYSFTKKKSKIKRGITQLLDKEGNLVTEKGLLANMLQDNSFLHSVTLKTQTKLSHLQLTRKAKTLSQKYHLT